MNNILYELGINIPLCVAFGREKISLTTEREYIITKSIHDSITLIDYYKNIFNTFPRIEKKRIIREFAIFIRNLHDKGILHSDLHAGNILVKTENDKIHFYLLDLYKVKKKSRLTARERCKNLALLNINFFTTIDDSLRYLFFKVYANGIIPDSQKIHYMKKIETISSSLAANIWLKRKKRCLQNNNLFSHWQDKGTKIYIKKGWNNIQNVVASPERFFRDYGNKMLKNGRTATIVKVDRETDFPLFLKRYNNKGIGYSLKNLFLSSRAKNVWGNSYSFEMRGLPTPIALAYREDRRCRILKCSYIINEFITDGVHLNRFVEAWGDRLYDDKKNIMILLGKLIQRMHFSGCFHGDLKWNNILLKEHNGHYNFYLTDLDGSKVKKRLKYKDCIKDIGRFSLELQKYKIETELKDCFFQAYYKKFQLSVSEKKFLTDINIQMEKLRKRKTK